MTEFAIQPTVTQRVRAFLAAQGVSPAPWAPLDQVYVELHALLRRERDDPAFWGPLEALLGHVVEGAVDPGWSGRLPAPQAELLSAADVGDLARDLRAALRGGADQGVGVEAVRRFTGGVSAAVLAGFLLLGVAASGCSDDDRLVAPGSGETVATQVEPGASAPPPTAADAAPAVDARATPVADAGPDAAAAEPACALDRASALWRAVDSSARDDPQKRALCECLAGASPSWSAGLTRLFERGTPAQIAAALERLVEVCAEEDALDGDYAAVDDPALRPRPRQRSLQPGKRSLQVKSRPMSIPQVAYRGVSF